MKATGLKDFEKTEFCYRCKACTFGYEIERKPICPAYEYYHTQAHASMGKVQLVKALQRGIIELDPGLRDVIYQCTTCGACMEFCNEPFLRTHELGLIPMIEALRAEMVEAGYGPMPKQRVYARNVGATHNPYGEEPGRRFAWLPKGAATPGASTVYFAGCTASYREKELARATASLLSLAAEPFDVLGDGEWCCGSPLIRTGQLEQVEDLVRHNVDALRDADVKRIIVSCAGCYNTITNDWPKVVGELPFKVEYITEFLDRALKEERLRPAPSSETVTYHDPCHLRHFWNFESPRDVLSRLPGVRLEEMPRNREEAFCCGAGGGVKAAFPDFALSTARDRVAEAVGTGASTLITSCPFCVNNLNDAADAMGNPIRIADITTYLLKRCTGEPAAREPAAKVGEPIGEVLRCNICGFTASDRRKMSEHMLEHATEV